MSEITDDYRGDDNVHRYGPINAKASELSGSGTISDPYGWLITEDSLPDELIDSDESTSEASGGGTIRFSTDEFGSNQLDITVTDFTPASGGASGGATAEIWIDINEYTGGTAKPVYVWWITGGSQTQSGTAFNAHTVAHNASTNPTGSAGDVPDDSPSNNDGQTLGSMAALAAGPGSLQNEWVFDGTNDEIEWGAFDVGNNLIFEFWLNATNTSSRRAIVGKHASGGGNEVVLLFWETGALTSIVNTSVQTSGTSNTGDAHWMVEFEESGSDTIVRWYKDGSLHLTQTHTGQTIGDTSGGEEWRWGQEWDGATRSDFWLGTMAAMRMVEGTNDDLADVASTHYSNQNNASNFWDTASATYAAGPFTATPTYQFTYIGKERTWTGGIYENDYSGSTTTICIGREMRCAWGRKTNTLDSRMRAAEMSFEVYDPDLSVYNYLSDETRQESDFYFEMSDSTGTYTLRMRIRLDEIETFLVDNLREHVTKIYCYCSLAEMKNIDAYTPTSSTLGSLIGHILISNGISQNIEIAAQHYPKNIASTGVLWDLMRLNRLDLIFIESGRKQHNMYDQLKGLLEGFGMWAFTGLDGQWHVKHEYALGDTLTSKRGAFRYDVSSGALVTLNTLQGNVFSLVDRTIDGATIRRPIKAVQAIEVNRGNPSDKFITVDLVRFGDFEEGWVSDTEHCSWTAVNRSTDSDTGTYAALISSGTVAYIDLPRFSGAQNIDFELAMRLAIKENTNAAGASRTAQAFLYHLNTVTDGTTPIAYGQPDGWSESIAGIAIVTNSVGAASTPVYSTFLTSFRGPLVDEDGFFRLNLLPLAGLPVKVYVDTVELRVKSGENAKGDFTGVNALYDNSNVIIGTGEVVEQRVQWFNGLLGLDPDDDGDRDSVHEMMQVLTTASGDWIQMAEFNTEVFGFTGIDYNDPFELMSDIRISQQNKTIEQIEGKLLGLAPPDYVVRYNSNDYLQVFTEIDFMTEVTEFVATRKILGSKEQLEFTNLFAGMDESGFSAGPDNMITSFDGPADITSVPWDSSITPWDDYKVYEESGTSTFNFLRVDIAENKMFFKRASNYLYCTDLEGNNLITTTVQIQSMGIDRVSKRIYVYNLVSQDIECYDYDLNLIAGIYSISSGASGIGGIAVNQTGTELVFIETNAGSSTDDFLYRLDLSTFVRTEMLDITSLGVTSPSDFQVNIDEAEGIMVFGNRNTIYKSDYPTASGWSTLATPNNSANTLNRVDKKIIYGDSMGNVNQMDYDGSNQEIILDWPSTYEIICLNAGQS